MRYERENEKRKERREVGREMEKLMIGNLSI